MKPEISRRCPTCGASIRARAFFCPHCGKKLQRSGTQRAPQSAETILKTVPPATEEPERALQEKDHGVLAGAEQQEGMIDAKSDDDSSVSKRLPSHPVVQNRSAPDEKGHRATAAAREVIEETLLPQVEKLRKVSNLVIDQAAYDPSLRFVLVAVLLFAFFLLLLLLNEVIG